VIQSSPASKYSAISVLKTHSDNAFFNWSTICSFRQYGLEHKISDIPICGILICSNC